MKQELPARVLTELREKTGRERKEFAELTGWSYHTQFRLEENKTLFKRTHLDALLSAGWIKSGDEWTVRFEEAIAYQAEKESEDDQDDPSGGEENGDSPEEPQQSEASATRPEPENFIVSPLGRLAEPTSGGNGWEARVLRIDIRTAVPFAQQIDKIREATALAQVAMDELSSIHNHAEEKVDTTIRTVTAAANLGEADTASGRMVQVCLERQRQTYLNRVDQIIQQSDGRISKVVDGTAGSQDQRGPFLRFLDALFGS
jgi:hypothetical protein